MNKHKIMENEKVTKLLLKFSLPAIVGMIVNALYNLVDRYYIGNMEEVGDLAIAGLSLTFPIVILIFAFSLLIGLGGVTNVSLALGKKEKENAEKYFGVAICLGIIVSILLTIFSLIFLDNIVGILGGSEKISVYAKEYLKILILGFPASILGYIANASIRADGNPNLAMVTLLIGAITNIILDPIFIFVLDFGIKGAAIATIISQYLSGIWAVYYFFSKFSVLKLRIKNIRLNFTMSKEILMLGSAPFAVQIGGSLVNLIYNKNLTVYGGDSAVGAMGVVQGVIIFISMPIFGINQGIQPILGYNYGAKLYKRVKETYFTGIIIATVFCVIDFIIIQLFSENFIEIFSKKQELVDIATKGLKIQTLMLPVIGISIISSVYFQAVGKPKLSLFMSLSRQVIILIPCIIVMAKEFGVMGVWYAGPTADFLALVLTVVLMKIELDNLNKNINSDISI